MSSSPPPPTARRDDVLRAADKLHRAATLLRLHARRCTVDEAPAHARALNQAAGMVRAEVTRGDAT